MSHTPFLLSAMCAVLAAVGSPGRAHAQSQFVNRAGPNKCLVVQNASRAQGTPAILWDCVGGDNEKFTAANTSLSVYGGSMCLDTYPAVGNNGDPVKIWPCHGGSATDSQRWTYTAAGQLRNVRSGRCLDIQGGNASATTNGRALVVWDCTGNASQGWAARTPSTAAAPAPSAPAATPKLTTPTLAQVPVSPALAMMTDDGRCIYGGNAMGVIGAGQCTMGYAVFKPVYHSANYYTINTTGGPCVTMPAAKGGPVSTQPCTEAATQRFYFNSSGQIQQVGSGLCIDVAGGQRNSSYRLVAWDCDYNRDVRARAWNQRFTFAFLVQVPAGVRLDQSFSLGGRSLADAAARGIVVAPSSAAGTARLISQDGNSIVAQGGGNLVNTNGSNIVAQGGGNVIAIAATNIVAQGGGNIVAQGGGNVLFPSSGIVAQGGGNIIFVGHS